MGSYCSRILHHRQFRKVTCIYDLRFVTRRPISYWISAFQIIVLIVLGRLINHLKDSWQTHHRDLLKLYHLVASWSIVPEEHCSLNNKIIPKPSLVS